MVDREDHLTGSEHRIGDSDPLFSQSGSQSHEESDDKQNELTVQSVGVLKELSANVVYRYEFVVH